MSTSIHTFTVTVNKSAPKGSYWNLDDPKWTELRTQAIAQALTEAEKIVGKEFSDLKISVSRTDYPNPAFQLGWKVQVKKV